MDLSTFLPGTPSDVAQAAKVCRSQVGRSRHAIAFQVFDHSILCPYTSPSFDQDPVPSPTRPWSPIPRAPITQSVIQRHRLTTPTLETEPRDNNSPGSAQEECRSTRRVVVYLPRASELLSILRNASLASRSTTRTNDEAQGLMGLFFEGTDPLLLSCPLSSSNGHDYREQR